MLGDTITMTLDGSGGTAVVAPMIDQGTFSTTYLKKRSLDEITVTIKHSKDSVKAGTQLFDRHNVLVEQYVYPTVAKPLGVRRIVQLIIRNDPSDDEVAVTDLAEALIFWATDANLTKLFGWES